MNGFMKYDHGTLASAFFEHTRRTDANFRRQTYDLRTAMYKSTYQKEFYWPKPLPKSNDHQYALPRVEPRITLIPKLNDDEFKQLYTPKIVHRRLSINKGIEPPLEYSNRGVLPKRQDEESEKCGGHPKSLYQESYINRTPSEVHKKEETIEEWTQKWKNECPNVRGADDLVQNLANQIVNEKKNMFKRKRICNF